MKSIAPLSAVGALLAALSTPLFAEVIPIEEEFVVAQQLHVDASLDAVVMQLAADGLFQPGATFRYEGSYQIVETASGVYAGSYSGALQGAYLGEPWSTSYSGEMYTDALQNKIWELDSKGEWKQGPYKGKKFTDKGKLTEKPDNKADLDLEIETEGVEQKITTSASNLDKVKGGGKLTVTGSIDVTDDKGKKNTETLKIVLDQAAKTFTSELTSPGPFGIQFVVLKNEGTFTVTQTGQEQYVGETQFDIRVTAVSEPAAMWMALGAIVVLVGARKARGAPLPG